MLGGCEGGPVTVALGATLGARHPGDGVCCRMGRGGSPLSPSSPCLCFPFLHPGQQGAHLAGLGIPLPRAAPSPYCPPASCFLFPSLCSFSGENLVGMGKAWWGGSVYFPGACFWTCGFAGGQITFQVRPPDAAGKQPPAGRRAIFSPLSRMCPGASSFPVAPQRATAFSLGAGGPSPAAAVGLAPSGSPDLAQPIALSPRDHG